jgi:ElaB/YqjD/DUF883 family membrane-anchored ribosome-binding protein
MGEATDVIRRDIDNTQRELAATAGEIQRRLTPRYIANQARESVRRTSVNTTNSIIDRIKENPIPAALVGVGLFMLFRNGGSRHHDYQVEFTPAVEFEDDSSLRARVDDVKEKASHLADRAQNKASEIADRAQNKASEIADRAQNKASELADRAQARTRMATRQTEDFFRDNPLIAGLAVAALGAIIGGVVPETHFENQLMGEKRDELLDRGKDIAQEGIERAKHVAQATAETAKNTAKDEARAVASTITSASETSQRP